MKVKIVLILIVFFLSTLCFAKDKEEKRKSDHYPVNISIYYPLSINKSKSDSVNFNFSLLYGHVGEINGFDFSLMGSVVENRMKGFQITGLFGVVGEDFKGIQVSGLANVVGQNSKGLQLSGLFNVSGEEFKGLQSSGIFNVVGEKFGGVQSAGIFNVVGNRFEGIQASGIFNVAGESFKGIQASGIFNVTGESFLGLQASGFINISGKTCRGLQLAPINIAADLKGIQVGLINVSGTSDGVQLGLINYSKKENKGVPIGAINLAQNGRIKFVSWGSNLMGFNAGVKFMVNDFYSILYIGGFNLEKDINKSLATGVQYGVRFPFKKTYLDIDLGFMNIDNDKLFEAHEYTMDHHVINARALLGIHLSKNLSIFAGGGINYLFNHYEKIDSGEYLPMFFAGIEIF